MTPGHRIAAIMVALLVTGCVASTPVFAENTKAISAKPDDWHESNELAAMLTQKEQDWGLPRGMAHVLAYGESRFKATAVSPDGNDWGLTQLNRLFLADLVWRYFKNPDGTRRTGFDWRNPEHNATVGCAYLANLIRRLNGSVYLGIVAYNWGPGHLARMKAWSEIPRKTLQYANQSLKLLDAWDETWRDGK